MKRFVDWMASHKMVHIVIIAVYYVSVVLPHKRFGTFLNDTVVGGLGINNNTAEGRQVYNGYAISIAAILLGVLLFFFIKHSRKLANRKTIWFYMITNIIFAVLIVEFLFVVNIEFVHFPQYAVFAVLLFPLIGNYKSTMVWATLAGMIDEAYQYFYLAPMDTAHYDFNDVLTNLVGVVFGLLLLRSMNVAEHSTFKLSKATFWYGIGAIILVVGGLHLADILSIYPSEDHEYHIIRKIPDQFWSKIHPNVTYHIVKPIEGIGLTCLLWVFFSKISPHKTVKVDV